MVVSSGRLRGPDGHEIAYDLASPAPGNVKPGVVFLHGLASDRTGTKAQALGDFCAHRGYGFLRFDMYGHGQSTGRFEDAGPSRWRDDTVMVLDRLTTGPQIIVGSSMGGWIMLLVALARPARVAGLIGIAAAPDFTEDLMWDVMDTRQRAQLQADGVIEMPSDDGETPMRLSRHLIEDGRANLLLRADIDITCPVALLHGQQDHSVPWQTALRLAERLTSVDVATTLIKDGEHRLSRPQDLDLLYGTIDHMMARI
jgi:pimeloyl-ACP methyl ester carboxylesterase